jgi:hypothetical protein
MTMVLERKPALLWALITCALLANVGCGDDSDVDEDGGVSGEGGGGGSGDGDGDGDGDGPGAGCLDPLAEDVIFSPRNLSEGSVIYKVVEDDGMLYFGTIDRIFRVPADGGEPEELYYRELAIVVQFWVRADDILILRGGDTLYSLPKEGGEPAELAELPFQVSGGLDGTIDFIVEGDFAYAKTASGGGDEPVVGTYHEVDLTTYETREIVRADNIDGTFVKSGDALYIAADDPSVVVEEGDFTAFVPDLLYRVAIEDGAVEPIDVSGEPMKMGMLGADADSLYLLAAAEVRTNGGVYRLAKTGGALEQVRDTFVLFGLTFAIHSTETKTILRDLDTFYEIPASGPATELFCIGGGSYTSHGSTATDDYIWTGVYHSDDEDTFIVRKAIP